MMLAQSFFEVNRGIKSKNFLKMTKQYRNIMLREPDNAKAESS